MINTQILEQVKECILQEPSQFDMDVFYDKSAISSCGTASCIAGWIAYLGDKEIKNSMDRVQKCYACNISNKAIQILGVKSDSLFYTFKWPFALREKYENAKTDLQRAKVACQAIDWFISEQGKINA